MLDKWSILYIKLPLKIAKLGAAALDRQTILIAGGIYGDTEMSYQYVNSVYKLDLSTAAPKWVKQTKMITKRTLYSTVPSLAVGGGSSGSAGVQVYAVGGSVGDSSEVWDSKTGKWT